MGDQIINTENNEKFYLQMVREDGLRLGCIKNQTETICLEAVQENGLALKYVKNQTSDICAIAIRQNIDAVHYIDEKLFCLKIKKIEEEPINFFFYKDVSTNTYHHVENYGDLLNSVHKYIETKYGLVEANKFSEVQNNSSSNDDKYAGLYLKKKTDNIFELHKKDIEKKNNGWIRDIFVYTLIDTILGEFIIAL